MHYTSFGATRTRFTLLYITLIFKVQFMIKIIYLGNRYLFFGNKNEMLLWYILQLFNHWRSGSYDFNQCNHFICSKVNRFLYFHWDLISLILLMIYSRAIIFDSSKIIGEFNYCVFSRFSNSEQQALREHEKMGYKSAKNFYCVKFCLQLRVTISKLRNN